MVNRLLPTPLSFIIFIYINIFKILFNILNILWYNSIISYKVFKCKRAFNKRTNLGRIYLVNIYVINKSKEKLNITWLTKKNGTNWGIYL